MNVIFMNSKNRWMFDPYTEVLNLSDELVLKRNNKHIAFANLNIYYTWTKTECSYKNNKFNISATTWNEIT